ncbi:MAG: hypothetical protein OES57_18945, partial [Acidimicrobiia bacterium]|nr:hypothetical protein [Acidimicrobiia bacterium]
MSRYRGAHRKSFAEEHARGLERLALWVAAGTAAVVGWVGAQLGVKGLIAVAGAVTIAAVMVVFDRHRSELLIGVAILSSGFLIHKAFTGLAEISSGPPSIYVHTFDIMIFILWFAWFLAEPFEIWPRVKAVFRDRVMWAPVVAAVAMLPGLLAAEDTTLALAELVRMASMFLLFVFLAARLRTRTQLWMVIGALFVLASVEAVVVAGQYVTSSALGLSSFGTPTILHNRFDGVAVARPFGTMAHPVFMAAVMGAIAVFAYGLAVNLQKVWLKWVCLGVAALGVSPLLLASARSASLGVVVAFVVLTFAFLVLGRLDAVTAGWWLLAAVALFMV